VHVNPSGGSIKTHSFIIVFAFVKYPFWIGSIKTHSFIIVFAFVKYPFWICYESIHKPFTRFRSNLGTWQSVKASPSLSHAGRCRLHIASPSRIRMVHRRWGVGVSIIDPTRQVNSIRSEPDSTRHDSKINGSGMNLILLTWIRSNRVRVNPTWLD
jgi:hypothetical protein